MTKQLISKIVFQLFLTILFSLVVLELAAWYLQQETLLLGLLRSFGEWMSRED